MKCAAVDCSNELPPNNGPGRKRVWCSDRCRRKQYAGTCVDCGALTNGHNGPGKASVRCVPCSNRVTGDERRIWTADAVALAIEEWAAEYGEPPRGTEWNPWQARYMGRDDWAQRFEAADGQWPSAMTVVRVFGSWSAGIAAAGFKPRSVGRRKATA